MEAQQRDGYGGSPAIARRIAAAARAALRGSIAAIDVPVPDRTGDAPDPFGLPGEDAPARVARLTRALRAERRLGLAGHWSYDLNRHIALAQQLRAAQAPAPSASTRSPAFIRF